MRLIRAKNYDDMSLKAANIIAAQVSLNPKSVLGLATGSTPIGTYRHLVEWYQKGELDFGKAVSINLDEYCGLSGEHPQSYRRFMRENLFDHINIPADRSFLPDGTQTDSALECAQYDRIIEEHNGIDLQLLGIGRNAHIGFNEPDSCFACGTHQVTLTESTIAANTHFFENEAQVPRQAYSMGMQAIMQAKRVLLIASGADKAGGKHIELPGRQSNCRPFFRADAVAHRREPWETPCHRRRWMPCAPLLAPADRLPCS